MSENDVKHTNPELSISSENIEKYQYHPYDERHYGKEYGWETYIKFTLIKTRSWIGKDLEDKNKIMIRPHEYIHLYQRNVNTYYGNEEYNGFENVEGFENYEEYEEFYAEYPYYFKHRKFLIYEILQPTISDKYKIISFPIYKYDNEGRMIHNEIEEYVKYTVKYYKTELSETLDKKLQNLLLISNIKLTKGIFIISINDDKINGRRNTIKLFQRI